MLYTVKYHAGTYHGEKTVEAEDGQEAINKVRAWVRKLMVIPMYTDGYKIIKCCDHLKEKEEK